MIDDDMNHYYEEMSSLGSAQMLRLSVPFRLNVELGSAGSVSDMCTCVFVC